MNKYKVMVKSQFCYGEQAHINIKTVKAYDESSAKEKALAYYWRHDYKWAEIVSVEPVSVS